MGFVHGNPQMCFAQPGHLIYAVAGAIGRATVPRFPPGSTSSSGCESRRPLQGSGGAAGAASAVISFALQNGKSGDLWTADK